MHLKLTYILAFYFAIIPGQTKYCCYPVTWESVNFERDGLVGPGSKTAVINEVCRLYIDVLGLENNTFPDKNETKKGFRIL
jgi:hypothetical protein